MSTLKDWLATQQLVLSLPSVPVQYSRPRAKPLRLNMNVFMRAHHRAVSAGRKLLYAYLDGLHLTPKLTHSTEFVLEFVYYRPDLRRRDLSNMVAVIDKHVTDYLVTSDFITDDSCDIISTVIYHYGGKQPKQHYIDITLYALTGEPYERLIQTD